jgi:hypothetical protein
VQPHHFCHLLVNGLQDVRALCEVAVLAPRSDVVCVCEQADAMQLVGVAKG